MTDETQGDFGDPELTDRAVRQKDIIPAERLAEVTAVVIGVGAIGRQVAIQLAAIGVSRLLLIDFDIVAIENLAAQGFREIDLGEKKVDAVAEMCKDINSKLQIRTRHEKFRKNHISQLEGKVAIFSCVDSMKVRAFIWQNVRDYGLFLDGRMSAEVCRTFAATPTDLKSQEHYDKTLFDASEGYQGSCTAKTTIYCASLAGAMMVQQFTKWLRRFPLDYDVSMNLLAMEMGYGEENLVGTLEAEPETAEVE